MNNWVHNLAVYGNNDQIKEFKGELDKLGYNEYPYPNDLCNAHTYITTNFNTINGRGYDYFTYGSHMNKTYRPLYLPQDYDLALALCGMRKDSMCNKGEWYIGEPTNNMYKCLGNNKFLVIESNNDEFPKWAVGDIVDANPLIGRKASTEEITKHFESKQQIKMDKKIIGYKAPYDLFGGKIEAGTVYVPSADPEYYSSTNRGCAIVKEIVETWEPVYEEQEVVKSVNVNGLKFQISKEGIFCVQEKRWLNIGDIRDLVMSAPYGIRSSIESSHTGLYPKTDTYTVYPETFKIGCTSGFTREDIRRALNIYNDLNSSK